MQSLILELYCLKNLRKRTKINYSQIPPSVWTDKGVFASEILQKWYEFVRIVNKGFLKKNKHAKATHQISHNVNNNMKKIKKVFTLAPRQEALPFRSSLMFVLAFLRQTCLLMSVLRYCCFRWLVCYRASVFKPLRPWLVIWSLFLC